MSNPSGPDTIELARRVRIHSLKMASVGGSSHIGSALSIADVLAVLYGYTMNVDPQQPQWEDRDRFILSKGHAGAAVYAVLAEMGFFPTERLQTHYQDGSDLSGHVSHKGIAGVELSTGSLGHGLPVATGRALAAKLDGRNYRVYVLMSDGECDEGSNWESALFASHHQLSNLVAIIDYNKLQSLGTVSDTLDLEPLADKWRAFGWSVLETDGHDHRSLMATFAETPGAPSRPTCVIAHTVKGKGVSFMENEVLWHYRTPRGEEFDRALSELENEE